MKLAILGATGPSGIQVVKEALARGHEVTAVVRNPDKLTEKHENLKIVTADIFDSESLVPHFEGRDAVLSCLGCGPSFFSIWTITFYTDSVKSIVAALRKAKVTRFVCMASWYTKYDANDPFIINWVLKPLFLGQSLHNMGQMEDFLEADCSDIRYTSVRPPQLTNGETSGKPVLFEEGQRISSAEKRKFICCRRDVARFMLDVTEKDEHIRKCMAIASG
ncbi:flavin reductase (NADPH)-like [Mya arenaria]|uniref:flavin reductase (NADPH)-like n=1 Tax=Mya arenaria TaxID=6604 RepID=UPI0022E6C274|nr:flavin reductase (NADPH)-like [Mya arenaria]